MCKEIGEKRIYIWQVLQVETDYNSQKKNNLNPLMATPHSFKMQKKKVNRKKERKKKMKNHRKNPNNLEKQKQSMFCK